MPLPALEFRQSRLDWSRVYIAGVINITPDSFSDGGRYLDAGAAIARGRQLAELGADLIDIGGESTRPRGAQAVSATAEIDRVLPVVETLAGELHVPVSIDTTKAEVARAAVAAGAEIINDISGGLFDREIIRVAEESRAVYICGHVRGSCIAEVHAAEEDPPDYEAVAFELLQRVASLPVALRHRTIVDPGLGFGKKVAQNIELIRFSRELGRALGCPVMVGPSRKRFIRSLAAGSQPNATELTLDAGTVGASLAAASAGVNLVRVHNVELLKPALMVYEAILDHDVMPGSAT